MACGCQAILLNEVCGRAGTRTVRVPFYAYLKHWEEGKGKWWERTGVKDRKRKGDKRSAYPQLQLLKPPVQSIMLGGFAFRRQLKTTLLTRKLSS